MPTTYTRHDEAAAIAAVLIRQHHPHLITAPIAYVSKTPAAVPGRARLVRGLNAFLARRPQPLETDDLFEGMESSSAPFFVLEFAGDVWEILPASRRAILVDHQLAHLGGHFPDLHLLPHDVEEFTAVVARGGITDTRIFDLVAAAGPHLSAFDITLDPPAVPSSDVEA